MLMHEIMTAGSKRRKTETEQGWLQRLWEEAKEQTEEARTRRVGQEAQVVAPQRAHRHVPREKGQLCIEGV